MSGERKTTVRATWAASGLLSPLALGTLWFCGTFLLLHKGANILWMKTHLLLNHPVLKTNPLQTNPKLSCFRANVSYPAATLKHAMKFNDCKASSSGPNTQTSISATGKRNATTAQKSRAQRQIPDKNGGIDRGKSKQQKWWSHSEPTGRHPDSYHSDPAESLCPLPWLLLSNRSLHQ